jgi:hypothetical protein
LGCPIAIRPRSIYTVGPPRGGRVSSLVLIATMRNSFFALLVLSTLGLAVVVAETGVATRPRVESTSKAKNEFLIVAILVATPVSATTTVCQVGYGWNGNNCQQCQAGQSSDGQGGGCKNCPAVRRMRREKITDS